MGHLSHRDFDTVLRILPELYANRQPVELFERSLRLIRALVGFDYGHWLVYDDFVSDRCLLRDVGQRRRKLITLVESEPRVTATVVFGFEQNATTDPFDTYWTHSRDLSALMNSDFPTVPSRPPTCCSGVNYALSVPVSLASHAVVRLSVGKNPCPFTERDRQAMNLLQPHLQRAYANAQLLCASRDEAAHVDLFSDRGLTARESEIARWLAHGKTNAEMGLILGIACRTVEKHIEHLLKKLHVENRTTAAIQIRHMLRAEKEVRQASATPPPASAADRTADRR